MVKKIIEKKLRTLSQRASFLFIPIITVTLYIQFIQYENYLTLFFRIILILCFFILFYKSFINLLYSYWTFNILLMIYFLFSLNISPIIFLGLLSILSQAYILSSPLFYPRVRWWKYDSRFKEELKISIKIGAKEFDGRLTDLRRRAGAIILFEELSLGQRGQLLIFLEGCDFTFNFEVHSKKEYLKGRGVTYGISFILKSSQQVNDYELIKDTWHNDLEKKKLEEIETFPIL